MKTIVIAAGITLTATAATIAQYERECADIAREREAIAWLDSHTMDDPDYSDIFKDVYGVRPRCFKDLAPSNPWHWQDYEALEKSSGLS